MSVLRGIHQNMLREARRFVMTVAEDLDGNYSNVEGLSLNEIMECDQTICKLMRIVREIDELTE